MNACQIRQAAHPVIIRARTSPLQCDTHCSSSQAPHCLQSRRKSAQTARESGRCPGRSVHETVPPALTSAKLHDEKDPLPYISCRLRLCARA
jgi:hypothetical protein